MPFAPQCQPKPPQIYQPNLFPGVSTHAFLEMVICVQSETLRGWFFKKKMTPSVPQPQRPLPEAGAGWRCASSGSPAGKAASRRSHLFVLGRGAIPGSRDGTRPCRGRGRLTGTAGEPGPGARPPGHRTRTRARPPSPAPTPTPPARRLRAP